MFLAFQYPVEIPGVSNTYFLKAALNAKRKHLGLQELDAVDFLKLVREKVKLVGHGRVAPPAPGQRGLLGRREEAQRDLPHGGARADARRSSTRPTPASTSTRCKIVADGVNTLRSPERAFLVITHYQRLLNYIVPDRVHVLLDGRIVRSGGKELALELEEKGYVVAGRGGGRARGAARR